MIKNPSNHSWLYGQTPMASDPCLWSLGDQRSKSLQYPEHHQNGIISFLILCSFIWNMNQNIHTSSLLSRPTWLTIPLCMLILHKVHVIKEEIYWQPVVETEDWKCFHIYFLPSLHFPFHKCTSAGLCTSVRFNKVIDLCWFDCGRILSRKLLNVVKISVNYNFLVKSSQCTVISSLEWD